MTARTKVWSAADCADAASHTPGPTGYLAWHNWAAGMSKTHVQKRCPTCGSWEIWQPRAKAGEAS